MAYGLKACSCHPLNSPHQQKAPVSAYWQSIMGNRLHGTQECDRFYLPPVISD